MQLNIKRLTLGEAKAKIAAIDSLDDIAFEDLVKHWSIYDIDEGTFDSSYADFRKELIECFKSALIETDGKMSYLLDLRMGIKLHELINPQNGFTVVMANDDDIWRYISVSVMPDITYLRYPKPEQNVREAGGRINRKRFFTGTRRIWLKSLWWYIHLSWQGSADKTYEVLKNNATDNINKLIETPGRGYRTELYRDMVREYNETFPHKAKDFGAMTKMNNVKCLTVEPAFTADGIKGYTKMLCKEIAQGGSIINAD